MQVGHAGVPCSGAPYLWAGVQLEEGGSAAPLSAPGLGVGVEVVVRRLIQCLVTRHGHRGQGGSVTVVIAVQAVSWPILASVWGFVD